MRTLVTAPAGTRDAVNFLDVRLCCIAPRPDNGRPARDAARLPDERPGRWKCLITGVSR